MVPHKRLPIFPMGRGRVLICPQGYHSGSTTKILKPTTGRKKQYHTFYPSGTGMHVSHHPSAMSIHRKTSEYLAAGDAIFLRTDLIGRVLEREGERHAQQGWNAILIVLQHGHESCHRGIYALLVSSHHFYGAL